LGGEIEGEKKVSAPESMLTPEKIAALREQMKGPPPPEFIAGLPEGQKTELAAWVKGLMGRPNPADMFAKVADGMLTAGLKEAQDFENFVSTVALPDIRETLSRIEATLGGLTVGRDDAWYAIVLSAHDGKWKSVNDGLVQMGRPKLP
jgi:hypothetical protein